MHNFVTSRAVDLIAKKLAGLNREKLIRFTNILSEEAQRISEELQYHNQSVSVDIIAARLEGFLQRLKYELHNQGPDPLPYEFPIFNISHPNVVYPKPINYLYDKRYKEPYTTYIQPSQTPFTNSKPELINSESSRYYTYVQHHATNPSVIYYEEPTITFDQYSTTYSLHQSSTDDNNRSQPVSRSTSHSELARSNKRTKENSEKLNSINDKNEIVTTRRIYAAPDTVIGSETMTDLLKLMNSQTSVPSQSESITERVVIIDRPNSNSTRNKRSKQRKVLLETSASIPSTTVKTTSTNSTSSAANNIVSQASNSNMHQTFYQQPTMNMSTPYSSNYSTATSYSMNSPGYYPLVYYTY